ncbi:MAG: hypothetical protein AAGA03_06310, partial [Planctomycetota bacterium]
MIARRLIVCFLPVVLVTGSARLPRPCHAREPIDARLERVADAFSDQVERIHLIGENAILSARQMALKSGDKAKADLVGEDLKAFQQRRELPGWLDSRVSRSYTSQMTRECNKLSNPWVKAANRARSSGDIKQAAALEQQLGRLLVDARGHGLALPPRQRLFTRPYKIRNSGTGQLITVDSSEQLILRPD